MVQRGLLTAGAKLGRSKIMAKVWLGGGLELAALVLALVVAGSDGKQADQQRAYLAANAKREDFISLQSGQPANRCP